MGYYSSVVLVLPPEGVKKFEEFKTTMLGEQHVYAPDKHIRHESGAELMYWSSAKWYDEFPEVKVYDRLMKLLEISAIDYLFIRYGEDLGDISCSGEYYDNPFRVKLITKIVFSENGCTTLHEHDFLERSERREKERIRELLA